MVHTPRRTDAPEQLVRNRDKWTDRFVAGGGDWATRKAKQILRQALHPLAHGKCVYCESALEVTTELTIDHYFAKSVAAHLTFEWTNLLPACRNCNGAKAEADHAGAVLKPDSEDPEPFFWIHPDTGKLEAHPSLDLAGSERAIRTIEFCNLQRPALCTQRILTHDRVARWLDRLAVATGPDDRLNAEWNEFTDPRCEYKFVLRHAPAAAARCA
jgi:uncharacterized protein (TIGR02646 family)